LSRATRSGAATISTSPAQAASEPWAAEPSRRRVHRRQKHSGRRRDPAVEPKLSDGDIAGQGLGIDRAQGGEHPERDREVVMRPLLGKIGRRQVDGDPLGRKRQPDRGERGVDSLAALGHRLVGKPDDEELGQARRNLDLYLHGPRLEPEERHRGDMRNHEIEPSNHPFSRDRRPLVNALRNSSRRTFDAACEEAER
jgi:hypothetical protein